MTKLPKDHEDALKTPQGSRVLVVSLNKEVAVLKKTVVKTQNELEDMRTNYHAADKKSGILASKLNFYIFIEVIKYLVSALLTAWGFVLVSDSNKSEHGVGALLIIGSAVMYVALTIYEKFISKD